MRLVAAVCAALALSPAASALDVTSVPTTISFGDPVVVTATGTGEVELDLGFWTALGAPETKTRDGVTTVTQRVACLAEGCVPSAGTRSVALPRAASGGTHAGGRVRVAPRVSAAAVEAAAAVYARDTSVPPPRRHTASVVGLTLAALALAGLLVFLLVPRDRGAVRERLREDALVRALRLLRESAGRTAPDRRRAADLAGRVAPAAATLARDIAWSRPEPRAEELEELASRLEGR